MFKTSRKLAEDTIICIFHSFWKWLYLGKIWVTFFSANTIVAFYVHKSIVHITTITTIVSEWCRAVHKVLFTKRNKLASLLEVLSFQRTSLKNQQAELILLTFAWLPKTSLFKIISWLFPDKNKISLTK